MALVIAVEDPRQPDVRAVVDRHLAFARAVTPPELVFAFDLESLRAPSITFCVGRVDGEAVAIGALHELDPTHGELKSMHVVAERRGEGLAQAMVEHLLGLALARGMTRVSLETGAEPEFAPARRLYARLGFSPCPPFGPYDERSVCMTRALD